MTAPVIGSTAAATSGIDHTYDGDLIGTVIADDATTPIQGQTSSGAPFTGRYCPAQSLATFTGLQGNGTWTLNVSDNAGSDVGSLHASTLRVAG